MIGKPTKQSVKLTGKPIESTGKPALRISLTAAWAFGPPRSSYQSPIITPINIRLCVCSCASPFVLFFPCTRIFCVLAWIRQPGTSKATAELSRKDKQLFNMSDARRAVCDVQRTFFRVALLTD